MTKTQRIKTVVTTVVIAIILGFIMTSCTFEFTDDKTECDDWNKEINKEIETIRGGFIKLTPSKVKAIEKLELLKCNLN
jgi:hypothetical protein